MVIKALEQTAHPVTVKQLRDQLTGPYKLPEERLSQVLKEQVSAGRIHRFAAIGRSKQPRYWPRDLEEYACEIIVNILAQRPHTESELLRKLRSKLGGFSDQQQKNLLARLMRERQIRRLPPFIGGRTVRFAAQPPDPRDYIKDAFAKIGKKLGLSVEEVLIAARTLPLSQVKISNDDLTEKLLARMVQIKLAAAQGGLVPLNELWRSLENEGWDKTSFDRTVLSLAENYRVSLQRHNFPASLSEVERAELVTDELGNYYVGIALR